MRRYSEKICPRYQAAAEVFGKRWTSLILSVLQDGPLRFSELQERLEVVSDRVLIQRLKELEQEKILLRRVLPGTPIRVAYRLTPKGKGLGSVIAALEQWAERWV